MHVDLQFRALPRLICLFPRIQFLLSSHSPLFLLGMEREFGADGATIIDMPSGTPIRSEAYAEFGRALEVLKETQAFAAAIENAAGTPGKLLVLLEGETDPIYMRTAAEVLRRRELLDKMEFAWVGQGEKVGLACCRFRRHRVRCFDGTGGGSWRDGSLRGSSSLRRCA